MSYPEVNYDAYVANTDDFESFKTNSDIPINTTVVTYNDRGLSGTGFLKQEDGTWEQVGIYNDENSIPENIVRGKIVNGVEGSYVDISNYGNLSIDGSNIRRQTFSANTQFGSVQLENIILDVDNKVYCDIAKHYYGHTIYAKSALDSSIELEIPRDTFMEHVYLGNCDVYTFATSNLLTDIELQYTEIPYTITGGQDIGIEYVQDLKLYVSNVGSLIGYTASILDGYNVEMRLYYNRSMTTQTLHSTSTIQTISNITTDGQDISIIYTQASTSQYVDNKYYAPDDTEQVIPLTLETFTSGKTYNETTEEYSGLTSLLFRFYGISVDYSTQYLEYNVEIKHGDEVLYNETFQNTSEYNGKDVRINTAYQLSDLTINVISASIKSTIEFTMTYLLKDVDGNYITPEDFETVKSVWFEEAGAYGAISDTFDTTSTPVKRIVVFKNINMHLINLRWYRYTDWQAYTYINLTDEQLQLGSLEEDLVIPLSKTKYIGLLNPYILNSQRSSEANFANIIFENGLKNASGEDFITDFRQFGDHWYCVSDTIQSVKTIEKTDIMLPDNYTKPYKGPLVLPASYSSSLSTNYGNATIARRIFEPNNCYLDSLSASNSSGKKYMAKIYVDDKQIANSSFGSGSSCSIHKELPVNTLVKIQVAKLNTDYNVSSGWLELEYTIPGDKMYNNVYITYDSTYLDENIPNQ